MKINEILVGQWNAPSIPEETTIPLNIIGTYDGFDIHMLSSADRQYFLIIDSDQKYMGYIAFKPSRKNLIFYEAYVTQQNRRRGICSILILFVLRKLNKRLVLSSDEIITVDSRQLFYQLASTGKIKISKNRKPVDLQMLSKIFMDDDNNIELVIEGSIRKESTTCNEIYNPNTKSSIVEKVSYGELTRDKYWYD